MGTIPVANPSPPRRLRLGRRPLVIVVLAPATIGAVAMILLFSFPSNAGEPRWVNAGKADDFELRQPVRNVEHRFWLIKLDEGNFLALLTRDPHLGCAVPWRPDFVFDGKKGWFRNPCHGQTYDLTGRCFFGPCERGMDRFQVSLVNGNVLVDTRTVVLGPPLGSEYSPCSFDSPYWVIECTTQPGATSTSVNP
jgi:Rieske Fe-S protein